MAAPAQAPTATHAAELAEAWDLLESAPDAPDAPFRVPALATMAADGGPAVRSVILRAADRRDRALAFHTDSRSSKIAEMTYNSRLSLLFFDADEAIQLRVAGIGSVHASDPVAEAAWGALPLSSRRGYLASPGPGEPLAAPGSGLPAELDRRLPTEAEATRGFAHFAVVLVAVAAMDIYRLDPAGHRRCTWVWDVPGAPAACWRVP